MAAEDEEGAELLTVGEVARMCGLPPRTILRWIALGTLPCVVTSAGRTFLRRSDVEGVSIPGWHPVNPSGTKVDKDHDNSKPGGY